jgi:hypothetical protein
VAAPEGGANARARHVFNPIRSLKRCRITFLAALGGAISIFEGA